MNRSAAHSSLMKKYTRGYLTIALFAVVCLAVMLISMFSQSRQYERAFRDLSDANSLGQTLEELNSSVNLAYLWLSEEGEEGYGASRDEVEAQLSRVEQNLNLRYVREIKDTVESVRTYVEQADELLKQVDEYVTKNRGDFHDIEEKYAQVQKVYTYCRGFLQAGFHEMLGTVDEMRSSFEKSQRMLLCLVVAVALAGGILVTGYLVRFYKDTAGSIRTLQQGMVAVQENLKEAKPIELATNDELEEFAETFNRMLEIIQEQMKKIEENADIRERLNEMEMENLRIFSELQKSHLQFLQSRINPHFLFNTLNMISSMARMENADTCADMMEITASFLRYNLDNISNTVTLKQEIDNLRDYVAIQEYRYNGRYRYEFDIDESCLQFHMPCMILQPLVENAIQHGIAMRLQDGFVKIHVARKEDRMLLEIEDNGVGMTEEQIRQIEEDFRQHKFSEDHIGLRNIYYRLQLFYSGDLLFQLIPRSPGLKIVISLPFNE